MSAIDDVLARIAVRRPKLIDLSLDRVYAALEKLGDPHKKLPPVIHVAGTNGKGSTVAYLRSIFESAGKSAHVYTSPHLVRFNERIVVAGEEISDAALIDALQACDAAVGDDKLTYFETTTCAALLAFSRTPADVAIIEVGLGGRLDATNVFERPAVCVITPVDFDHQQFLGDSLAGIALEKAGIMRRGAPVVIGRQQAEAMAALDDAARKTGARAHIFGQHWSAYAEHGRLIYQDEETLLDLDPPRLAGQHQYDNAGLAVAAIRAMQADISADAISRGVATAFWPARLQRLTQGPLIDLAAKNLGTTPEVWLDGGHNPHAGAAVARAMADFNERAPRPLVMICGLQAAKDARGYFAPFAGLAREVFAVAAHHEGVADAEVIAAAAAASGVQARACVSLEEAVALATAGQEKEPPRLLIGGSLYLAGEVLKDHG